MLYVKRSSAIAVAMSGLVLSGCWWDSSSEKVVAASDLTKNVTSSTVSSVTGSEFKFSSGVSGFGTTGETKLKFSSASTFEVSSAQGTASGDTSYGSCIFTVHQSTFPTGSPLALGQTVTIDPCNLTIQTAGLAPSSTAQSTQVILLLGTQSSSVTANIVLDTSGNVSVNGTAVGSIPLTGSTGSTGGGG